MSPECGAPPEGIFRKDNEVEVSGKVRSAYRYRQADDMNEVEFTEAERPGLVGTYRGVPLKDILAKARPEEETSAVMIKAADGYVFFVTLAEVESNGRLLLARTSRSGEEAYSLVGAENRKAWISNVAAIEAVSGVSVGVSGALERPSPFVPDEWQAKMNHAFLDLGYGVKKYQGIPLATVLKHMGPLPGASKVLVEGREGRIELSLDEVLADPGIRLYGYNHETGLAVAFAHDSGTVYVKDVTRLEVA
jgi:DMSO/TMAO reductase YedYZ molybdopterin-dependent catalytic subunit